MRTLLPRNYSGASGAHFANFRGFRHCLLLTLAIIGTLWLSVIVLYFQHDRTLKAVLPDSQLEWRKLYDAVISIHFNESKRIVRTPELQHGGEANPLETGPMTVRRNISFFTTYPNADADHLHGVLGLDPVNGLPLWTPRPKPKITDMAYELQVGGGFNLKMSNAISLDRLARDSRSSFCRHREYNVFELPEASVIIVFFNEPFSTLARSVHSVLNRSPPSLLKEILLVDDGSTKSEIYSADPDKPALLQRYVKVLPKVRLIRNPQRTGIVGARLLGIQNAAAEIFVILDSHIEVQPQWLEPLVSRIKQNRRYILMPVVDGIEPETFEYSSGGIGCTLGFIWKLMEHSFTPDGSNPKRKNDPDLPYIESPTMAGGLFAAHKQFFLDLGAYDTGMRYWGAENIEFSFRLWQCGGILECARCSRVYHIFRKGGSGYSIPDPNSLTRNKLRLMDVWMDEYADLAWQVLGRPNISIGDVTPRRELRKKLKCKPFEYFLTEVWPESQIHHLTEDVPYLGRLKHPSSDRCLTFRYPQSGADFRLGNCDHAPQLMYFRTTGRIMPTQDDEECLGPDLKLVGCESYQLSSVRWTVTTAGQLILETKTSFGKTSSLCLAVESQESQPPKLQLAVCESVTRVQRLREGVAPQLGDRASQIWTWEKYRPNWPISTTESPQNVS